MGSRKKEKDRYEMKWAIVEEELNNMKPDSFWCTWQAPKKIEADLALYDCDIEEFILANGSRTGVLRCAQSSCNCNLRRHRTSLNQTKVDLGAVKRFLKKHRLKDQPDISSSFLAARPLPRQDKNELRLSQVRLCSAKGLPLCLFESKEFRTFMSKCLKDHVYRQKRIDEICCSARTIGRFSETRAELNISDMKIMLPFMVDNGAVNLQFDHKFVSQDQQGKSKVLGVTLCLISDKLERQCFMIEYYACRTSRTDENLPLITALLESYDLLDAVQAGRVAIITDQAANHIASLLSPLPVICSSHSLSCCLKRSVEVLCTGNAKQKWCDIIDMVEKFGKRHDISALPFIEAAPSLNIYVVNQMIQNADHIRNYRLSERKSHWTAVKESNEVVEMAVDSNKSDCHGRALERNLRSSTRFRKYTTAARNLLLNESLIQPLMNDRSHPHAFLAEDLQPVDFDFLRQIEPLLTRIERAINRFESDFFQNGYAFLEEMQNLLIFSIKKMEVLRRCSASESYYRSVITAIVEQLVSVKVDNHGNISRPTCKRDGLVPQRILDKDIAAAFLNYELTYLDFKKVTDVIGDSEDNQLNAVAQVLREESSNWRVDAVNFISELGRKWRVEELETADFDNELPEEVELEGLKIDSRLKHQLGLNSHEQPETLTLRDEITRYKRINAHDIKKHELFVKEKEIPQHLKILSFWRENKKNLPLLAKIAQTLISSGNSSSSQERNFGWSSLQTSVHRKNLKPRTLLRMNQSASYVDEFYPCNNNKNE